MYGAYTLLLWITASSLKIAPSNSCKRWIKDYIQNKANNVIMRIVLFSGITSLQVLTEIHDALGNPVHPVLNPDLFVPMDERSTFVQRLYNFLYVIRWRLYHKWNALPHSDKLARKYFGKDLPYLGDLEKNLSLVIASVNPFTHGIRPNVPRIIEVSQLHTQKKYNPLPDVSNRSLWILVIS